MSDESSSVANVSFTAYFQRSLVCIVADPTNPYAGGAVAMAVGAALLKRR